MAFLVSRKTVHSSPLEYFVITRFTLFVLSVSLAASALTEVMRRTQLAAKLATLGGLPFLLPVPPLAPSQVKQYNIGNVGIMHTGELGLAN